MQTTDILAPPSPKMTARLINGDCLKVMPHIEPRSYLVFCDLPYGSTANKWDCIIPLDKLWKMIGLSSPGATAVFSATQPFTTSLINSNPSQFRYDLVWHKNTRTGFLCAKKMPLRAHESLLVFYQDLTVYNPQKTAGHKPVKRSSAPRKKSVNWDVMPHQGDSSDLRYPCSVLPFARDDMRGRQGHPTQKPVALLEWLIKTYTNPGDTVLDPVSGSATTAIAALRTGRNVICIEKDKTYFDAGVERVRDEIATSGVNAEVIVHG